MDVSFNFAAKEGIENYHLIFKCEVSQESSGGSADKTFIVVQEVIGSIPAIVGLECKGIRDGMC